MSDPQPVEESLESILLSHFAAGVSAQSIMISCQASPEISTQLFQCQFCFVKFYVPVADLKSTSTA